MGGGVLVALFALVDEAERLVGACTALVKAYAALAEVLGEVELLRLQAEREQKGPEEK